MDKNALMQKLVKEANEKSLFTGTWLFAEDGQIVSKGAVGFRDPEDKLPMQEDTVFELASVSKHFTATGIMLLRKRGLLDLDDDIQKFFPEIPYKGVKIRNLLNHTGGLPDYEEWIAKTAKAENTIPGNEIIVRFLVECGQEPLFAPGEQFCYSNTGYCLLAQIIEKVSGVKYDDFMKKNVFEPAGMVSTRTYHRRKDGIQIENYAYGMVLEDDKYILPDNSKESNYVIPLDGMSGDGIVNTNIFDMFAWDKAQRNEVLLSKEEQMMMYTPGKLNNGKAAGFDDRGSGYGFGWMITNDPEFGLIVEHGGGWPGYHTQFKRFIDANKVLVILCCREGADSFGHSGFFKGMNDIAEGKEPEPIKLFTDMIVKDPDKSEWESYCGKYEVIGNETALEEVMMKDGDLWIKVRLRKETVMEFKLYPTGEKTFGIKETNAPIVFGDGCVTLGTTTVKKL